MNETVLPCKVSAIDKFCYVTLRELPPFFSHKHRIVYSKVELVNEIETIGHHVEKGVLNQYDIKVGLEIHHDADLPARSGLGSSSSFTVGLIHALSVFRGDKIDKKNLANQATYIEQVVLKEAVGNQDQIWASYGGFNRIDFDNKGNFKVAPIILEKEQLALLNNSLVIVFSGVSRISSTVARSQLDKINDTRDVRFRLREIVESAHQMVTSLNFELTEFGKLINESWNVKKELDVNVSNPKIDEIYQKGLEAGAYGGKLLGAGNGGFILFIIDPTKREKLKEALRGLITVDVNIDWEGSKLLFERR